MFAMGFAQATDNAGGETEFTSASANSAKQKYAAGVTDAQQKLVVVLKQVQGDVMRSGQLEEANRLAKMIAAPGEAVPEFTSLRAKAAVANYVSLLQRLGKQYQADLKVAMAQNLKAGQLEEANRVAQEIKRLDLANGQAADPVTGFINLVPYIKPETGTVAGKWTVENGAVVSSGKGEERIQIAYQPPEEYDYKVTFTVLEGDNCLLQLLAEKEKPFIWALGMNGAHTFRYLKGTGIGNNRTSVKEAPIRLNDRHTSIVRVRKTGAEAVLDGKVISKWPTNYDDVATDAPWWLLKDHSLLGLGSARARTVFHTVEVKEVSGPGKFIHEGKK